MVAKSNAKSEYRSLFSTATEVLGNNIGRTHNQSMCSGIDF